MDDSDFVYEPSVAYGYALQKGNPTGVSEDGKWVSPEDYLKYYYDHPYFNYEWCNGLLEEKPMSNLKEGTQFEWFCDLVKEFLKVNPVGLLVPFEMGIWLGKGPDPDAIRKPDKALILFSNPVQPKDEDATYKGIYNWIIESLSSSTLAGIHRDTVTKKREYAKQGVPEYSILDAEGKNGAFYRLGEKGRYRKIIVGNDKVVYSQVLPGFAFRLDHLQSLPAFEEIMNDPPYSSYLFKNLRNEKQRADDEKQRANEEKQRADEEKQRADEEKQRADEEKQRADQVEEKLQKMAEENRKLKSQLEKR